MKEIDFRHEWKEVIGREKDDYLDGGQPAQNLQTKKDAVASLEYHLARQ